MNYMNILKNTTENNKDMEKQLNFEEALTYLKQGYEVTNSRGNILYMKNNKIFCIPKAQYPKGAREEVKIYWDAILQNDWSIIRD